MRFLKENAFLVTIGGVLVVAVALLIVLKYIEDGKGDAYAAEPVRLSERMGLLARRRVNKDRVFLAEQRVQKMRSEAGMVEGYFLRKDHDGYKIMTIKVSSGRAIPAFPLLSRDSENGETLRRLFPGQYRQEVQALLDSLKPTVPPTKEEITEEAARITAVSTPTDGLPEGRESTYPSRVREPGRPDYRPPSHTPAPTSLPGTGPGGPAGEDIEKPPTAEEQAQVNLTLARSKQGWVYADEQSMYAAFSPGTTHYSDEELWLAHVGLWIQKDIIEAINLTNGEVQKDSGGAGGVQTSAVKRLVNINIHGYVLGRTPVERGRKPSSRERRKRRAGEGEATPAEAKPVLEYMGTTGRSSSKAAVFQLTERACNKLYDVTHYDFTVVLPMRHLLRLQKNLLEQNCHTILNVRVGRSSRIKRVGKDKFQTQQEQMYYYGTDPVMEVTITGELLLLADWTRGRWNPQEDNWDRDYPRLVPETFLEGMRDIDPDALRQEDNKGLRPITEEETLDSRGRPIR